MEQTWRWYGPADPVTLEHAKQAGATGIVTALHDQYDGRVWTVDDILKHKQKVEAVGLRWSVCESIPIDNSIKMRSGPYRRFIDQWKQTLANLGRAGITTVCYNFMPVIDWMRTDLMYRLPSTGYTTRFDQIDFAAFDIFILNRRNAESNYSAAIIALASKRFRELSAARLTVLENTCIGNHPAREALYTRESISALIDEYNGMSSETLRTHLFDFLREVMPVAQEVGLRLAIHPDDPPFSLFGLPRIVSTAEDARAILNCVDVRENGLTLCTGSYGTRADNDILAMVREFAPRIHFAHLRNTKREEHGSFFEAEHLDGDTDMVRVVEALLLEERRRRAAGRADHEIPMRPDHGHLLVDDIGKEVIAGYSCIGRLKGLAELRGVMRALDYATER